MALKSDGTVWSWGANYVGGTSPVPSLVTGLGSITQVAAGSYHSLALDGSGVVWAWGYEYRGELGDGVPSTEVTGADPETRTQPCRIGGLNETSQNPVIQIAAGPYYSLALKQDTNTNTVWEWGMGLGPGEADHTSATQVLKADGTPLTGVVKIAAGGYHALALDSNGNVWAWGLNSSGELGNQTTTSTATAVEVTQAQGGAPLAGVTDIQAGSGYSMALMSDGSVWTWGQNQMGGLGDGLTKSSSEPMEVTTFGPQNPAVAIHAGADYNLVLTSDGRVWVWGNNFEGQFGNGTAWWMWNWPAPLTFPMVVPGLTNITAIGGLQWGCYAIDTAGRIWSWGNNVSAILGQQRPQAASAPVVLLNDGAGNAFGNLKDVSAGAAVGIALGNDGSTRVWGWNGEGALGDGTWVDASQPFQLTSLQNIQQIAAGKSDCYEEALDGNGSVWLWGQHCPDDRDYETWSQPKAIEDGSGQTLTGVKSVSAGHWDTLAIKSDSTTGATSVWAWGANYSGELGNGTYNASGSAVEVAMDNSGAAFGDVAEVSEGGVSLARKNDGTVWAWGSNNYGQLGYVTYNNQNPPQPQYMTYTKPVETMLPVKAVAISAGDEHSLALDGLGKVWAWGNNASGQLANGTVNYSGVPAVVTGLPTPSANSNTQVVGIKAGDTYSLALMSDGTVYGWGKLTSFAGIANPQTTPVQLPGLAGVASLGGSMDYYAHLLRRFDGSLAAWGDNDNGEVGSGGVTLQPEPYPMPGFNLDTASPTVTLAAPTGTPAVGTPVSLSVTATPSAGATIARVDYYNEGEWIGALTDGSTTWSWTPPTWGNYHIRAIETDSAGLASAYSNTVTLQVPDPFVDSDGDGINDAREDTASNYTNSPIASFSLDDASFKGNQGQTPVILPGESLPDLVPGFSGNAIHVDRMNQLLRYGWMRPDGSPNYAAKQGTISMWFKLDWNPATSMSGYASRLMDLGASGKAEVAVHFDASNPALHFYRNDGMSHDYSTSSSFDGSVVTAGTWHQVVVTYSPGGQELYLDGQPLNVSNTSEINGSAVVDGSANWIYPPKLADFFADGLKFGSDSTGGQPLEGAIDEVQIYNYVMGADAVLSQYNTAWQAYQSRTAISDPNGDPDGDGLTNAQEAAVGSDPNVADNPAVSLNVAVFIK